MPRRGAQTEAPVDMAHAQQAGRADWSPGSAITRSVFGETVSSGIIDGDPTGDWIRVPGKCTPALGDLKFVNDEGKLTRLVGRPQYSREVAMNKAQVCLMNFNFAAFESMEVCIYGCNMLGDRRFMIGVSSENIQHLCGQV